MTRYDLEWPDYDTARAAEDCVSKQEDYVGDLALAMQESQSTLTHGIHYVVESGKAQAQVLWFYCIIDSLSHYCRQVCLSLLQWHSDSLPSRRERTRGARAQSE